MNDSADKHVACHIGAFALAVLGARCRGPIGMIAVGAGALLFGYGLAKSRYGGGRLKGSANDDEPTPESADLGTSSAGPP
jgi:hypothetical protein